MARRLATRPRIAVAVGAGVLVLAGWWVVRAPAVERAVALPPAPDLDPPVLRGRRDEAIALAEAPDDPWTFAESLAASGAASAAEPVKEACGQDDAPQFSKPDSPDEVPVLTRAASPGYVAAQARVDAALRASGDPFDRAVADLLDVGDMRGEAGATEAVVQQAAASSDPRLYALGYGLCHSPRAPAAGCDALTPQHWTEIDPGNGIPWIDVLGEAQARGDADGVRSAMTGMAAATRFDIRLGAVAGTVIERLPADSHELAAAADLATRSLLAAASWSSPPYQALVGVCRNHAGGDEPLEQSCRTVSDTMFEHSDNLMSQSISGALLLQTTGDPSRRDNVRAERAILAAHWSPATGFSPCRMMRDDLERLRRLSQIGAVEAMREQARKFVPP